MQERKIRVNWLAATSEEERNGATRNDVLSTPNKQSLVNGVCLPQCLSSCFAILTHSCQGIRDTRHLAQVLLPPNIHSPVEPSALPVRRREGGRRALRSAPVSCLPGNHHCFHHGTSDL